ncbi:hypothetical protein [Pseudomonas sp. Marseille-Q8238]
MARIGHFRPPGSGHPVDASAAGVLPEQQWVAGVLLEQRQGWTPCGVREGFGAGWNGAQLTPFSSTVGFSAALRSGGWGKRQLRAPIHPTD